LPFKAECFFLGYLSIFGWYTAMDIGPRFVMGVLTPLMFVTFRAMLKLEASFPPIWHGLRIHHAINLFLLALVLVDACHTVSGYMFTREFGY
jgi:hypothetical protein